MTTKESWTQRHTPIKDGCSANGPEGVYCCTAHIGGWHYALGSEGYVCERWAIRGQKQQAGLCVSGDNIPGIDVVENEVVPDEPDELDYEDDGSKYPPWPDD